MQHAVVLAPFFTSRSRRSGGSSALGAAAAAGAAFVLPVDAVTVGAGSAATTGRDGGRKTYLYTSKQRVITPTATEAMSALLLDIAAKLACDS
jgi:nucleoside recognition membrane protein YjiH